MQNNLFFEPVRRRRNTQPSRQDSCCRGFSLYHITKSANVQRPLRCIRSNSCRKRRIVPSIESLHTRLRHALRQTTRCTVARLAMKHCYAASAAIPQPVEEHGASGSWRQPRGSIQHHTLPTAALAYAPACQHQAYPLLRTPPLADQPLRWSQPTHEHFGTA